MRSMISSLWIIVVAFQWATQARGDTDASADTVDSDGNGIQDRYEAGLAAKFVPAMVLDSRDNVSPEPVSFIGADSTDGLWVRLYNSAGQRKFDKRLLDVNPRGWDPPLIDQGIDGVIIKSNGNFSSLKSYVAYNGTPGESSESWANAAYHLIFHFEYTGGDGATFWRDSYRTEAENNSHADQVYAHLFKRSGTDEYVIQYWYFYPFNDWVNNHEGDWEHINVVVDSQDPELAQIERVEFYFHHRVLNRSNPGTDFYVSDETHPVIFTGGYGRDYRFLGTIGGKGPGGHGSYSSPGTWESVVFEDNFLLSDTDIDDQPNGLGRYIHWSEFQIEVIKDTSAYDFDANPEMSWLKARIRWGQPNTTSPGTWIPPVLSYIPGLSNIRKVPKSNDAPPGPRYNAAWGLVSAEDAYEGWTGTPPPVADSTWNMIHVPGDYTTISAAITAADSGTTIKINPGTYYESLTMKNGVNLASNYGIVTIRGSGPLSPALFNGVRDIKLEGLTFKGDYGGAEILNSTNITLTHCDFRLTTRAAGAAALYVSGASSSVDIDQCSFHNAGYGLNANGALYVTTTTNIGRVLPGKSRFYSNIYGIYITNNGSAYVPENNFSYPSPHNSTYDIYADSSVSFSINANNSFWGYHNESDSTRTPAVFHGNACCRIATGNPRSIPAAKPVSDSVSDRKRVASDLVKDAKDLLFAGQDAEAKAGFRQVFEAYADQKEEAIAALYGLVTAASKLEEGSQQYAKLVEFARTHATPEIRAAAAYLAIGLLHQEGHVDTVLAKMAAFEQAHSTSTLRPYLLLDKALLLEHSGDEEAAEDLFKQLALTYPSWPQAPLVRAKLQARGITLPSAKAGGGTLTAGAGPNPFNPSTTIRFHVPSSGYVSLVIYNVAGQVVKTVLRNRYLAAGRHAMIWEGQDAEGRSVASGVYLYRLTAGDRAVVRKITLIR